MVRPKLICFDYGETLIHEEPFNGEKGYSKILEYVKENPYNKTGKDLFKIAKELNEEIGRFDLERSHLVQYEISDSAFLSYILALEKLELSVPYEKIANVFWDEAAKGKACEGIEDLLSYLRCEKIKTCVISNMSFSGKILENRLKKIIPSHSFDFIISSSDYVFRKPNKRIFDIALKMAEVQRNETWHCGDRYLCDIKGAMNAGITPVWYTDKKQSCCDKNIIQISSWKELKDILQNSHI